MKNILLINSLAAILFVSSVSAQSINDTSNSWKEAQQLRNKAVQMQKEALAVQRQAIELQKKDIAKQDSLAREQSKKAEEQRKVIEAVKQEMIKDNLYKKDENLELLLNKKEMIVNDK